MTKPKKLNKQARVTPAQAVITVAFGILLFSLLSIALARPEGLGDAGAIAITQMALFFGIVPLLWVFFLIQFLLAAYSKTGLKKILGWCLIVATLLLAVEGVLFLNWNRTRNESVPFDTPADTQALESVQFQIYDFNKMPKGYYLRHAHAGTYETEAGNADFVYYSFQTNPRDPSVAKSQLVTARQVDLSQLTNPGNCEVYDEIRPSQACEQMGDLNDNPIYGEKSSANSEIDSFYFTVGTTRIILDFNNTKGLGLKQAKDVFGNLQQR